FFQRELIGRVTGHVDGRRGNAFYYLWLGFAAWLPWWPLLVVNWWRTGHRLAKPALNSLRQILGFDGILLLVGLIAFSAISSKLPTYTVLLAPWIALLFSRALLAQRQKLSKQTFKRGVLITLVCYGALLLAGMTLYPSFETRLRWNSSMRPIA